MAHDLWHSVHVTWVGENGQQGFWFKLPDDVPDEAKVTLKSASRSSGDPFEQYEFISKHNPPSYELVNNA